MEGEFLVKIESYNGFTNFLNMIHVNNGTRRAFLKAIPKILASKKWEPPFPKWMNLTFSLIIMDNPLSVKIHKKDLYQDASYKDAILCGGKVIQEVFDKRWDCDMDIFFPSEEYSRDKISNIDLIGRPLDNMLGQFDISISQIGITRSDILATPLFLYSYMTKKVFCNPRGASESYQLDLPSFVNPFKRHKHGEVEEKINRTHEDPFYTCSACKSIFSYYEDIVCYNIFIRWINRLEKYIKRFPEFEFVLNMDNETIKPVKKKLKF